MTARDFFDNLSETLMPTHVHGDHGHCVRCGNCIQDFKCGACGHVNQYNTNAYCILHGNVESADEHFGCAAPICHICLNPVTDSQLADGDAYVKDSAGNADGEYEHRECGQAMKGER